MLKYLLRMNALIQFCNINIYVEIELLSDQSIFFRNRLCITIVNCWIIYNNSNNFNPDSSFSDISNVR